jgi:putative phage-type endonuclease
MKVIDLEQGSEEWLSLRGRRVGASDSPNILGLTDWGTAYTTWRDKTGRTEKAKDPNRTKKAFNNYAIERGNRFEPIIRADWEFDNNVEMPPIVGISDDRPWMMASFDGYNFDLLEGLEIKAPNKEVFEMAKQGRVHPKYEYQLVHQSIVGDLKKIHFVCGKIEKVNGAEKLIDTAVAQFLRDEKKNEYLLQKLDEFWGYVERDEPPPLTEKDTLVIEDESAKELFRELKVCAQIIDGYEAAKKRLPEIKAEIIPFLTHRKVSCEGVIVTKRFNKKDGDYLNVKVA